MFNDYAIFFLAIAVMVLGYRLWVAEWWIVQLRRRMGIKR